MGNQEDFLAKNTKDGGFLQSDYWREFQENFGKKTFLFSSSGFRGLFIENSLPLAGKYWFCPRGPVFESNKTGDFEKAIKEAKRKKAGWIRIEPQSKKDLDEIKKIAKLKIKKSPKNYEPEETLMIDLSKELDEILKEMKPKTRYNIKLSRKRGVFVKEENKVESLDKFWNLLVETAERDKINLHPENYYRKMLSAVPAGKLKLFIAYSSEGEALGGILVSFYGGVATYLHGASSGKNRNLMANYGLQWHAIEKAKETGVKKYDLGGTALESDKKGWEGITKFKRGFCPGGEPVKFPGCYDLIINPWAYFLYRLLRKIKI